MSQRSSAASDVVVVTGANGLVGAAVCRALAERGATVRAVVRRAGTAPDLAGVEEIVGDFLDPALVAAVVAGAAAAVTTVHPMGSDRAAQHRVGVEGTAALARAARDAHVARLIHLSTAAVYDRAPGVGDVDDVDETSPLVGEEAGDYPVTKRDADAALGDVDGITRVLLRPPAILGPGESSVWNSLRPARMRAAEDARRANPEATFAWVHVADLASLAADVAIGRVAPSADPTYGPVEGGCTALNVAAGPATSRDYVGTVTAALSLDPVWEDGPAWTGQIVAARAHAWGWTPHVDLARALTELREGLRSE